MGWQRFGDVEYRAVEELEAARPRRRPRARSWAIVGAAALIVAAGAVRLTSSATPRAPHPAGALPRWRNAPHMHYGAAGIPPGEP